MNEIVLSQFTEQEFDLLKNHFKDRVNSTRRFEQIVTVEDLLQVLEDRCVVSTEDCTEIVDVFRNIKGTKEVCASVDASLTVSGPILKKEVVDYLIANLGNSWKELAHHLKVDLNLLLSNKEPSERIKDLLEAFTSSCHGICEEEVYFRLCLALKKCRRLDLKSEVFKLSQI